MSDAKAHVLAGLDLFAGSTRRELRSVGSLGTLVDVPAYTVLQRQGALELEFVVVLSGIVALEQNGRTAAILCAGEAWGDPPRAPQVSRHAATARTRSAVTVLVYTRREYESLLSRCPYVAKKMERARALEVRSRVVQCDAHRSGDRGGIAGSLLVGAAVGLERHMSSAGPLDS